MKKKIKEMDRNRKTESRGKATYGGYGGKSGYMDSPNVVPVIADTVPVKEPSRPIPSRSVGSNKAMKLGGKGKDVDTFVELLSNEGEGQCD